MCCILRSSAECADKQSRPSPVIIQPLEALCDLRGREWPATIPLHPPRIRLSPVGVICALDLDALAVINCIVHSRLRLNPETRLCRRPPGRPSSRGPRGIANRGIILR